MQIEIETLARKPLKSYDTNNDGKIDAQETSIFKEDCNKLYAYAYGEDSKQYKNLSQRLAQTTVVFKKMSAQGSTDPQSNDFEQHKYEVKLSSREYNKKLKDRPITLTDMAGILLHEEEHIQQEQSVYDQVMNSTKGKTRSAKNAVIYSYDGNSETYAEIERMNFLKKLGTFTFADKNESYKTYVEESNKVDAAPNTDKKTFFSKFNFEAFAKTVQKRYTSLDFSDKTDEFGQKNLLFE